MARPSPAGVCSVQPRSYRTARNRRHATCYRRAILMETPANRNDRLSVEDIIALLDLNHTVQVGNHVWTLHNSVGGVRYFSRTTPCIRSGRTRSLEHALIRAGVI